MALTVVTSSGHIHLPRAIREHLGIQPGDKLQLRVLRDGRVFLDTHLGERGNIEGVKTEPRGVGRLDTGVDWIGE